MMAQGISSEDANRIYREQIGIFGKNQLPSSCGNNSLSEDLQMLDKDLVTQHKLSYVKPTLPLVFEVKV